VCATSKFNWVDDDGQRYREWFANEFRNEAFESDLATGSTQHHLYEAFTQDTFKPTFEQSPFWTGIVSALPSMDTAYRGKHGKTFGLTAHAKPPDIDCKPWDSFVLKTWRKNVRDNKNWPQPPDAPSGPPGTPPEPPRWLTPETWYEDVKDIVRTTLVVRYLDGVMQIGDRCKILAESQGNRFDRELEARPSGYYALHMNIWVDVEVPGPPRSAAPSMKPLPVEIQVCTQFQEVIRALTHQDYEALRELEDLDDPEAIWQWDPQKRQFEPNYLTHILHYTDGMIMNIRERRKAGG